MKKILKKKIVYVKYEIRIICIKFKKKNVGFIFKIIVLKWIFFIIIVIIIIIVIMIIIIMIIIVISIIIIIIIKNINKL